MKPPEEQLTLHEGKRARMYRCTAGYLTAGVGRNLEAVPFSEDEIALMLRNDIARATAALDRSHGWWRSLDPVRQKVLVDMMFNLGPKSFAKFERTLGAVRDGRYTDAARYMLQSRWAAQVKGRAVRLSRMMKTGEDYTE